MAEDFNKPLEKSVRRLKKTSWDSERAGVVAERIARFTGTPTFLIYLTAFVVAWIAWNSLAPENLRFDSAALGFTALTLMLSLQASYSSPLILLAQNRQDDRDRVNAQNDRMVAERNLADTEYLTREIASLRMAIGEVATRDFVRSEIRDQLEDTREAVAEDTREAVAAEFEEFEENSEQAESRENPEVDTAIELDPTPMPQTELESMRRTLARKDAEVARLLARIDELERHI